MSLAGLGILFVLVIIGIYLLSIVLIILGIVFITKRIIQKRSIRTPVVAMLFGILVIGGTYLGLNLSSSRQQSFLSNQYASYPYTVFLPGKLPAGYSNPSSGIGNQWASFNLTQATLYEFPADGSSAYYRPPDQCYMNELVNYFSASQQSQTLESNPCTLLVTAQNGVKIYGSTNEPDYGILQQKNTVLVFKEKNISQHLSAITQIVDNLKPNK